jgi:hypothetical protein
MSFKEVKELRKTGHLEEALLMAQRDLENEHENIWNKRSIAWVYYDYLKQYTSIENFDRFKEYLEKIKSLSLPADEKMIFDNCAFQIGKLIYDFQKEEHHDYTKLNDILELIRDLQFTKPSESYSFLYKAFHKAHQNWSGFLEFADWWDFENFRSQDYLPEEYNGKKQMSLVEQAYIAYAKKALEGPLAIIMNEGMPLVTGNRIINREKISEFLPKLEMLIEHHPEFQYPPYFKAKLLLALGDKEDVLSSFLPFAKMKRNDFWVWELMSDVFDNDDERKVACLCKALSLNTPDSFLINIRQKLAELLISQKKYQEAKTEIEIILTTRRENDWRIPNQISAWTKQTWYQSIDHKKDNRSFYYKYLATAEEILFQDIPEEIIVVEFVNKEKNILNFVKDKTMSGFFNYSGLVEKPTIGDILKVRFKGDGQEGFFKVLTAKKIVDFIDVSAIMIFKGNIHIVESSNIGFIKEKDEDIFIDSKLIKDNNIQQKQEIKGRAILSFNKKKNNWGWKAISIEK